ncbi:hypothetical protein [Vibrio parahaemolyticus]|uniref:hypothetical protein n=1 Tax=Vibrio parahaemolyticus TaxID=670 RepID=UPI0007B6E52F|nr:hypothetical protein [Vibrio parahaemolyticus]ANB96744.1 hypothetical protein FORC14_1897 [Vibrio parahaemolyticus]
MSKTVEEVLEFELKHEFHFVEVPDNVPEFIWKNANGEFVFMDSMGLDHLKASIGKVNRSGPQFSDMTLSGRSVLIVPNNTGTDYD